MKKFVFIIFAVLTTNLIVGQSLTNNSKQNKTFTPSTLTTIDQNPLVLIIVDSTSIKINSITDYDIAPKWIESVNVLKDEKSKQIYGNKNGVIIIYIKKKYSKKVLREIEKKKRS